MSVASGTLPCVIPWTLADIERALRASWAADTCSPDDLVRMDWTPDNPAWGHCDITALVVNDIFGGDLMLGEVHLDGEQHGYHWWNRLPSGIEIDLTRDQFRRGQTVTAGRVIKRPAGRPPRRWKEYQLLRQRVTEKLGTLPAVTDEPARGVVEAAACPTSTSEVRGGSCSPCTVTSGAPSPVSLVNWPPTGE